MLRTAKERWPLTKLYIIPIPVQGNNESELQTILSKLRKNKLGLDSIIIARGGGNREDLMLFDNEIIAREIATFPIPVICLLYTSPSPRDRTRSRMPSSA